jgi:orotate phosphoribosyltransferase
MHRDQAGWIKLYEDKGALWIHDGNPKRPHALLTSGSHSSGFFNSGIATEDPTHLLEAAQDLLELLLGQNFGPGINPMNVANCIIGPAKGATRLVRILSEEMAGLTLRACTWASPAKADDGTMRFSAEERVRIIRTNSMFAEDVVTTGGSVSRTALAARKAGVSLTLPFVLVIVNRSGSAKTEDGINITALINRYLPTWTPEECPLCKAGSRAIRPKDNWAALTAAE